MKSLFRDVGMGALGFGAAHVSTLVLCMAGTVATTLLVAGNTALEQDYLADAWGAPVVCATAVAVSRIAFHLYQRRRPLGVGFILGALATFASMAISSLWLGMAGRAGILASSRPGLVSYGVASIVATAIALYLWFIWPAPQSSTRV